MAISILNSLAHADGNLALAGANSQLRLTVAGGTTILGLRMHGTGGTLDPACLGIQTLAGQTITPLLSQANAGGTTDSLVLAELGPGSYTLTTRATGSSTGSYTVDVFMPGDQGPDGRVDDRELLWATAAVIQREGGWNQMTALFYKAQGIDLAGPSLYRQACDSDLDGDVDNLDLGRIDYNHGLARVTCSLIGDMEAPVIQAALVNDTGRSTTDGITSQLAIAGSLHDASPIAYFRAGFDAAPEASYVNVLADVDASGNFTFSQSRLEQIAGGPLANTGARVLHLIAQDEVGNAAPGRRDVVFTLDTLAPDAPTSLDLVAGSDLGFFDNDNITADNTPTITAVAESQALVKLYANGALVGEGVAASPVSITTSLLADGVHDLTATATDLAGNTSAASQPLSITIETVAPAVPTLDLAAASDTGTVGDRLTSLTTVTVEGLAEAGTRVTLERTGALTTADGVTGAYSFDGVPLAFGANALTVTAMDLAGNTRSFTQSIRQNNAPMVGTAVAPSVNEDVSPTYYDLTGLFADANLASGDVLTLSIVAGSNTNPALVTATIEDTDGSASIVNGRLKLVLAANASGTATITLRATDAAGESVQTDVVITVAPVNDAPTAGSTLISVEENTHVDLDLRTIAGDLETPDDLLVFSVSDATHGTIELLSDGHTARFTPAANYNGSATFKYRVTDTGEGASPGLSAETVVFVNVTPFNDPPVAGTTTLETPEDTVITVDLRTLASDTETPVDQLVFTVASGTSGTAVLLGDGHTAQFTPAADFNGTATFTYSVTDTGDGTAAAKTTGPVTITVEVGPVNSAPTITDAMPATTLEDTAIEIDLALRVSDKETPVDQLVFSLVAGSEIGGTAELLLDGHTVRFTPGANFNGAAGFTYSVTDTGDGTAAPKTIEQAQVVTVAPVNDAPVAQPTTLVTDEDTSVEIDLRTLVSDIETPPDQLVFAVPDAVGGTVTILADGHTAQFTPAVNFNGAGSFAYTVRDAGDGAATPITVGPITIDVTINAINDAPVAGSALITVEENSFYDLDLRTIASDVETSDDQLLFSVSNATNGTIELLLDGHTARFTPAAGFHGDASFKYEVTDTGEGAPGPLWAEATVSVNVTPFNDPPVAEPATLETDEDTVVSVDLRTLASDTETPDDQLLFSVQSVSGGTVVLVDGHTAQFTPTANFNGAASFTYTVTDTGDGTAAAKTTGPVAIGVTVHPINDAPAIIDTTTIATPEDTAVEIDLAPRVSDVETPVANLVFAIVPGSVVGGTAELLADGHTVRFTPTANVNGLGQFKYTVTDTGDGAAAPKSVEQIQFVSVTAVNDPPVAEPTTLTTDEDVAIDLDLWTLVLDVETPPDQLVFTVQNALGGTVELLADGHTARFTPSANHNDNRSPSGFAYTVKDTPDGAAAAITVGPVAVTVHVTPVNDAPVANDDSRTVPSTRSTTINVLGNDTDPDLVEGDVISIESFTQGSHNGTVEAAGDGKSLIYTPVDLLGLEGTETFSYTIRDLAGLTSTRVVNLTLRANTPPVAENDTAETDEDTLLSGGGLLSNDHDDDGDTPSVIAFDAESAHHAVVVVQADGSFTYDPRAAADLQKLAAGVPIEDTFTYTISDGHGGQSTATVTITVTGVNDAPVAADQAKAAGEDTTTTGNVLDGASDVDQGDTLVAVVFDGTSALGAHVTISATGDFVYDPRGVAAIESLAVGQTAEDSFSFTIDDGHGGQDTRTVTLTVTGANDPPTANDNAYTLGEDESLPADAARNLLANDTDVDMFDTLQAVPVSIQSHAGAAVTIHADGTFSYDPGTIFNHLAAGAHEEDWFTYSISDGHGLTDSATVYLTINGANDPPVGEDDTAATNESTPIDIVVLTNDTDPDDGDGLLLFVSGVDATSQKGAAITINANGTIHYDPTGSATLRALQTGQQTVDTFNYTVADGKGGTDTVTVSVTVTGQSGAPVLSNPIADLTLTDATSPQSALINLNTVFTDPDGDGLTFTAQSSNPGLVTAEIVNGNQLRIRYVAYTTTQNRTPAVVTVTATENTAQQLQANDALTVTVLPQYLADVQLVVLSTASASGTTTTLPSSITQVAVGSSYVVEVWMQDLYTASVSGGPSAGLGGGKFDLSFNSAVSQAATLNFDSQFALFQTGTINNTTGKVDDFGAATLSMNVGVTPNYARLGYITVSAATAGTQNFTLALDEITRQGGGALNPTQVHLGTATVNQVSQQTTRTFTIQTSTTTLQVDAVIRGAAMRPEPVSADTGWQPSGTLNVIVDSLANPTTIRFVSGQLDVAPNTPDGPFHPGIGGVDGLAQGDFAFVDNATGLTQMAIREFLLSFATAGTIPVSSSSFLAGNIGMTVGGGFADLRWPSTGGARYDMTGAVAVEVAGGNLGTWLSLGGNKYELTFNFNRTIDLSSLIGANSYMTVRGTVTAQYQAPAPLTGTQTGQSEGDEGTAVHLTLVKEPTALGAGGQVDSLPTSEAWIDEWDSYWVEVWVRTGEGSGVSAARVDLAYNGDYFTATAIDHGDGFVEDVSGELGQDGLVLGLGGATTLSTLGAGGYALLGRVKFESLDGDQVPLDADSQVIAPHSLGLRLDNLRVDVLGAATEVEATVGKTPKTELWAVPYDVDDDGRIGLGDLSFFAPAYGQDLVDSQTPFVWSMDYDRSGEVNLGDLSFFAPNYGKSKAGGQDIVYPDTFLRRWIGAGLEVAGDASVGELLDTAVQTWTDLLGLEKPIDVQLVVKDLGGAQLGEGLILEVNAQGVPIRGRVTLDDDAAGLGWYSQWDASAAFDQYDLYTVLLHEIGHTLGFTSGYEGFAEHVESGEGGGTLFVAPGLSVALDAAAQHLDAQAYAGDLMSPTLAPGVRKLPSELDAQILLAAYEAAEGGAGGFAPMAAAMHAAGPLVESHSTADLAGGSEVLHGEATWDRLLSLRIEAAQSRLAEAVDSALAGELLEDAVAATTRSSAARVRRVALDELASDQPVEELALAWSLREEAQRNVDAVWTEWANPLVDQRFES